MFRIHYPAGIVNPFFYIYIAAYFLGILAVNYKFAVNSNNSSYQISPRHSRSRAYALFVAPRLPLLKKCAPSAARHDGKFVRAGFSIKSGGWLSCYKYSITDNSAGRASTLCSIWDFCATVRKHCSALEAFYGAAEVFCQVWHLTDAFLLGQAIPA